MRRLFQRLFQVGFVLLAVAPGCFAQWQAGAAGAVMVIFGALFFLHGKQVEQECHNGQMWNVTYLIYIGLGKQNIVTEYEGASRTL